MNCSYSYIIEYPKGEKRNQILSNDIRELMCLERHVDLNNHEDVHYMKPTGKTGYRVGDADTFIKSLSMMPHGDLSIGVIDDADSMSEIIQNKLLKIIEEPPESTVIILLVSNKERLLSTIRSRCKIKFLDKEKENIFDSKYQTMVDSFFNSKFFYQFRDTIKKDIDSRDDALELIDVIECSIYNDIKKGTNREFSIKGIDKVLNAKIDIMNGMGYMQALKRLFLELGADIRRNDG